MANRASNFLEVFSRRAQKRGPASYRYGLVTITRQACPTYRAALGGLVGRTGRWVARAGAAPAVAAGRVRSGLTHPSRQSACVRVDPPVAPARVGARLTRPSRRAAFVRADPRAASRRGEPRNI